MDRDAMKIIIIGAGFGGIGLGVRLKRSGFKDFIILERSSEVGGVWRDNTYPGAACDVPSRMYSYSFASDYPWTDRFGQQAEILEYLKYCADRFGIRDHVRFDTEVTEANFDTASAQWNVLTADGNSQTAKILVSAVGLFNCPFVPDLPGQGLFQGPQFHSSRWKHDCKLAGKRVAVIGTGASAIQFVPRIAPEVDSLHVFQRSPQYVMPRDTAPVVKGHSILHRTRNLADRFKIYLEQERRSRRRGSTRMTERGQAQFLELLQREVPDPVMRRKLTPSFQLGCKRVLQSNDWYPALMRENVALIDSPVTEITPTGVVTRGGDSHKVDIIVYGTGFTPTRYLTPLKITGSNGQDLNEGWKNGAEAYLGMTVAGFPNFFMMYGPNTNIAGSIVYMLESQARYIADAARLINRPGIRQISVRQRVQDAFNHKLQTRIEKTVLVAETCHSYFQDPSGKVTTQWPGFMYEYRRKTRGLKTADFEIVSS